MRNRFRKFFREAPKVTTLLVLGAAVLFPMYMMFAISFMTPAQLERFPWFPLPIDVPAEMASGRDGTVEVKSAALELKAEGQAAETLVIPPDDRFQLHLPGVKAAATAWTVRPAAGGEAVVAELQAANVWTVRPRPDGTSFHIEERPFDPPPGFVSVLPGLRLKARAEWELRVVDTALRHAKTAQKAVGKVARAPSDAARERRRLDAAVTLIETEAYVEIAAKALQRARSLVKEAADQRVPAGEDLGTAEEKLRLARLHRDRAGRGTRDYFARLREDARRQADLPTDKPVAPLAKFNVDRGEAVAVLLARGPTEVTKVPGRFTIRTAWRFPLERRRLLRIVARPGIEKTPPEGRDAVAGRPLADLVADRDVELVWKAPQWLYEDRPFAALVPPGFDVQLPKGPDEAGGSTYVIPAGTVLATVTEPTVQVITSGESMAVGLALEQADGSFRIPLGPGRWTFKLRVSREMPFVIRSVVPPEARIATGKGGGAADTNVYRVDPAYDGTVAELAVNRQRTVIFDREEGKWAERQERVSLSPPRGFESKFAAPKPGEDLKRTLPNGTVLATLQMPKATVRVDDEFIIVSMTGAQWGDGQWEYPYGDRGALEALQVVKAETPQTSGDGPWHIEPRTDDRQNAPDDAVLEIRAIRKARLDYVDQRWHLDGRPVDLWFNEEALGRALDRVGDARTQLANVHKRLRETRTRLSDLRAGLPQTADADRARTIRDEIAKLAGDETSLAAQEQQAREQLDRAMREAAPLEKAAGFVPLTGEGEVLSTEKQSQVVEADAVLARLCAERPHPRSLADRPGAAARTELASDGRSMTVSFAHELPMPVRANVLVADAQRINARQVLCAFFDPLWLDTSNYREAADYVLPFIVNTVVVAIGTMVFSLFFASLAAFVFSRFDFPGKAVFYAMIIVLLMIPGVLNLVPMYAIVKSMRLLYQPLTLLGRINASLVLLLPAIAGGQVMNVYIMRNNLETLAKDLFDAARIDGASNFQTYWHIAIPLSRPIMGTLAIFALLSQWNNFIWPWVVIKEPKYMTITAGLALLEGQNLSDFGLQMAGAVIASIPLIVMFFFMMNLFIRGIQSGAIKA